MATESPTPSSLSRHHSLYNNRSVPSQRKVSHPYQNTPDAPNSSSSRPEYRPSQMPRSRKDYSNGDSSDDDVPEPIKFSASVKALLGEEASGLDPSPRNGGHNSYAYGRNAQGGRQAQSYQLPQERRARVVSPREYRTTYSTSPQGPRADPILRRSPSVVNNDSVISSHRDGRDFNSSYVRQHDFKTPAQRTRRVRVSGSRNHTPSPSSANSGSGANTSKDESYIDSFSSRENSRLRQEEELRARIGAASVFRSRNGEEPGMQGSLRVKRVGKLTGSFLNGPARRGLPPRQNEDERRATEEQDADSAYPADNQHQESLISVHKNIIGNERPVDGSPQQYHNGTSIRTQTPGPGDSGQRSVRKSSSINVLRTASPLSSGFDRKPSSEPNHRDIKSQYHVPAPLPLSSNRGQENDPPPTFKRPKANGVGLLDKIDKLSISHDNEKEQVKQQPNQESPRKALGAMSRNTPRRPAPPPPKMSVLDAATASAGAASSSSSRKKRVQVTINKKSYTRLGCIGRGGSSRVYRVMAENSKIFALKRVNLEDVDPASLTGYKEEINLLKTLEKVDRVVQLFDWEMNEEKHALSVLMEMGESDLYHILTFKLNAEDSVFDGAFTRFYWKEMLECVQAVHDYDIVHSDLKPANFLLVKGRLKLIDFGIANTIQDHTVNVHREQQIGTPNYMAPEALIDYNATIGLPSTAGKMMKVGKPSDVWSLGCILYQMVYGKPPFAHITKQLERIMSIPNPRVVIEFRPYGVGGVAVPPALIRILKRCLQRDPSLRPTISQLLDEKDAFLYPEAHLEGTVPITQEMLGRILTNVVNHCRARGPPTDEELAAWPAGFFAKIKSAVEEDSG